MAVIINELEVVVESTASPAPGPAAAAHAPQQGQHIQPIDVLDIIEREMRAGWRLLAH